jgi:16S rRNA processing protein RimM
MKRDREEKFTIAQFGKTFGFKGEIKLNLHTDFPEQFVKGRVLNTDRGSLEIERYNPRKGTIKLVGIETLEDAKKLTNARVYSSKEESQKYCNLEDGEYFWFDLIGSQIIEDGELLGVVKDISRLPTSDYLEIKTASKLQEEGLPKSFLIPYIPQFIDRVDTDSKKIYVKNSKDILRES